MKKRAAFYLSLGLLATMSLVQCSSKKDDPATPTPVVQTEPYPLASTNKISPSQQWNDTNGNMINAHSAGIYYEKGIYYWYGEHKFPNTSEPQGYTEGGIHCYRSKDLVNWEDMGVVLPVDRTDPNSDIAYGCRFQRPKIVFNKTTGKYVAFFKLYLKGQGVAVGYNGVGTATSPTGPFTYQGKFLAASTAGTGDFALYQEPNGDLYHFTVRKTDRVMVRAKMSDDYLTPATAYTECPGVTTNTEGPALFYRAGTYHLLGSGSSGWDPNPPRYFTSSSLGGPWTAQPNPLHGTNPITGLDQNTTFGGQPTFFLQIQGADNQYLALFDVWKPSDPINGRYIWLPFRVKNDRISIDWIDNWNLTWFDTH